MHGLELANKLGKHQYCCLSIHFYLYVCMFNLYWFLWNMNLEVYIVYMVHWMTFVNCFGAIYTLIPCTVLLTRVHTLKIILLNWFYLLLLYLLFCWNWCFIEISFWYFVFLFLLVLPIIFVLWFFVNLLYIFCILIVWNIVCSIKLLWFRSNIFTFIYIGGHVYFIIQREPTFTYWRSYGGVYMLRLEIVLTGIDVLFAFIQYLFIPQWYTFFFRSARMTWPVCGLVCCFIFETNNYLGMLVLKKFKLL